MRTIKKDSRAGNKHDNKTKANVQEASTQTEGVSKPITGQGITQSEVEPKGKACRKSMLTRIEI